MSAMFYNVAAIILAAGVLFGIYKMSNPKTAVAGNRLGAICMALAIILVLFRDGLLTAPIIWAGMLVGSALGLWWAKTVKMIQMPQLVALFNGFGGAASALVALLVLIDSGAGSAFVKSTAGIALIIGTLTLTGSLVAAGKLHQVLNQRPVVLKNHDLITKLFIVLMALALVGTTLSGDSTPTLMALACLITGGAFGIIFTIRVGGADMPITISLLNSFSGVAGAIAGLAIYDPLLVAVGGIVGASGLLLTQIMCRAMNRSLIEILLGKTTVSTTKINKTADEPDEFDADFDELEGDAEMREEFKAMLKSEIKAELMAEIRAEIIAELKLNPEALNANATPEADNLSTVINEAKKVVIIPGYGMALAQAQHKVRALAEKLEKHGAVVDYAIHPVAGRMPGHMNVLLAEADVDYDKLLEMDDVNPMFTSTDLVIIIGANDVVNPAAIVAEGTPIYGMPILRADEAKQIIVCNFDTKPGYAGVENPLYTSDKVIMKLGDAKDTVDELINAIN